MEINLTHHFVWLDEYKFTATNLRFDVVDHDFKYLLNPLHRYRSRRALFASLSPHHIEAGHK